MIEKNEVLQMLDNLEQAVLEIDKKMENRMEKERRKATRQVELDHYYLERRIALLEEKVNKSNPYTMLQSLA